MPRLLWEIPARWWRRNQPKRNWQADAAKVTANDSAESNGGNEVMKPENWAAERARAAALVLA